jgi:HEAT repeat protein
MPLAAAEALGKIGAPAVPALLKSITDPARRKYAVMTLGEVGPAAKDAVPALVKIMKEPVLSSSEFEVRREAIKTLGKMGQAALPALIAALRGKNLDYFFEVRSALVSMGPVAVPELIRLLQDPDPSLRNLAAQELGFIRPVATDTVTALALALGDPDLQKQAVRSLGELGPTARAAIPALSRALWDLSRRDEDSIVWSLRKIGPEAAPVLAQSLKHPTAVVRFIASDALVEMGSVAVRPVAQVLGDPNEGIQMLAEAVLLRMGSESVPELRKVAAEVPELRSRIEKTLRQMQEG